MRTRLHFKLMALLIVLSVIGLLVFQGYWLKGLYQSQQENIRKEMQEAMLMTDYRELFERIERLKINKSLVANFENDGSSASSSMKINPDKEPAPFGTLKVDMSTDLEAETDSIDLAGYLSAIHSLEDLLLKTMHNFVDSIAPVDYAQYDSILHIELDRRGIHSAYQLYIKSSSSDADSSFAEQDWKDKLFIDYPTKDQTGTVIRLHLLSPSQVVLRQMSGILSSSAALLFLILFAFVYLLRTILKQKTVEELKTDFTNNMTHELKTPISVSYAAIDALLNFSDSIDEKQRKYLSIVKEQLTHLTGLVEQILSLAVENRSTFRLHPETIHLKELVDSLCQQYRLKADKPVEFRQEIAEGLTLTADRTHIYNMLSNLIENALKYADKRPCIIAIRAEASTNEIRVSITDNGIGISEANRKRVFDKFFRIPNGNLHDVKGYGLGLYYVKDMMAKHQGTVSLESKPGKGSTFTLHFKQ